jgi:CRISPR/Cas system CMR-associated protein Cmr3 (group 5 of RAMP superfamily)
MKIYKLFCGRNIPNSENKVTDEILTDFLVNYVSNRFDGFTITHSQGFWKKEMELSFVLEFITDEEDKVKEVSEEYRTRFNQDCVIRQVMDLETHFE